jgi:predicted O-linked N-acetylglucosamine transferase (SPINDLY family)
MATIPQALAIALQHHQAGRLQAAEQIYRQILQAEPNQADAWHLLGLVANQVGRQDVAVEYIGRAIGLNGKVAAFHCNLGVALSDQWKLDEAIACYRRALELEPDYAEAYHNLGNALNGQEKVDEALACYRRALLLRPDFAEAHNNLGNVLKDQGKLNEALDCYRRALALKPDYAAAHHNLGNVLKDQGELDEAIACYRLAVELDPEFVVADSSLVYTQVFRDGCDAQTLYAEHRRWNQRHAVPLKKFIQPPLNDRSPNRRLRVGYVSPDFRDHVIGRNLLPLLREHDHQWFETVCYADVPCPDEFTGRFQALADAWRDTAGLTDEELAQRVRDDRIDILVDLTLHMAHNRLLVFARKPAPVQVTFAGYPGSTGLSTIDYRLTDPYLDPPGINDGRYSEESIRLPDSFWCYDPLCSEPAVNRLPAVEKGYVSFACLNNFCKINPGVLKIWAKVLKAVNGSRLTILAGQGTHRQRTLDLLERESVGRDRVTFVACRPRPEYLRSYHDIDIGLDTVPYNGHTTSLDSLWMGVPVVTLVGSTVVGRAGLCQLMNLGLPELVATSPEQYVRIAAELAQDLPRLSQLRATLRERMQASPLMNAPRFARSVEAAYRTMWQRWCAKQAK